MSRRVCSKVSMSGNRMVDNEYRRLHEVDLVDWISLPNDTVIEVFSRLNYRDRANLALTCRSWRLLGSSQCLWQSLDLRMHKCNAEAATSLASRCGNLKKLRFCDAKSADALIYLKARGLQEISVEYCSEITDATLKLIASQHKALESLQLVQYFCERISSDAITEVAVCCSKLQKLRLSGIREVSGVAINVLATNCPNLTDIGFIDCLNVDEKSLGNILSLRYLSVAGTLNINWLSVPDCWSKLPNLKCLDVSRTDIVPKAVSRLLLSLENLVILCALNCPAVENDATFFDHKSMKGKLLITLSINIFKGVASLFPNTTMKERNVFSSWRNSKIREQNVNEIMIWLEWILSHSLLRIAESNPTDLDNYWLSQGVALLLILTQSSHEDVQEWAVAALATYAHVNNENDAIGCALSETVTREGGIQILLNLAISWREGLQFEAARAIANLCVNPKVAKAVAEGGGISTLINLARSMNRLVVKEAAGGLWSLSVGEIHKDAFAKAAVVQELVDLIVKWTTGCHGVLERAAGTLANLAADNDYSILVVEVGGVNTLVRLARRCKCRRVQKQVARALANLASHGDRNGNNAAVGEEVGAVEVLVQLLHSPHDEVRMEAAAALCNLCFYARNREAITSTGGVEALVSLANSCAHASHGLQERVVGALWGLSVSEANSIRIGALGGIASLIALAQSVAKVVHETAAGALWTLSFHPINAIRIVDDGGIPVLVHLCTSSISKMVRFVAALTLTYIFDGRMDEFCLARASSENNSKNRNLDAFRLSAMKSIDDFIFASSDPLAVSAAATSSSPALLTQVAELAHISEAGHLRCSDAEIGRLTVMLRNSSDVLKTCAVFALLQFTFPGGRQALHNANLLRTARARGALRAAAAAATAPIQFKIFAKIVLRNIELHQEKTSV